MNVEKRTTIDVGKGVTFEISDANGDLVIKHGESSIEIPKDKVGPLVRALMDAAGIEQKVVSDGLQWPLLNRRWPHREPAPDIPRVTWTAPMTLPDIFVGEASL